MKKEEEVLEQQGFQEEEEEEVITGSSVWHDARWTRGLRQYSVCMA